MKWKYLHLFVQLMSCIKLAPGWIADLTFVNPFPADSDYSFHHSISSPAPLCHLPGPPPLVLFSDCTCCGISPCHGQTWGSSMAARANLSLLFCHPDYNSPLCLGFIMRKWATPGRKLSGGNLHWLLESMVSAETSAYHLYELGNASCSCCLCVPQEWHKDAHPMLGCPGTLIGLCLYV